jgi:diketogulonate reductase-like aldo/keto reductase
VALRWVWQQGVLIATSPGQSEPFMVADLELASFTLSAEEMAALSGLTATA